MNTSASTARVTSKAAEIATVKRPENHADGLTQWWTLPATSEPTTSRDAYDSWYASILSERA